MTRLTRLLLRLLPRRFRERFGDDLVDLIAAANADEAARAGRFAAWRRAGRELASLLRLSVELRRQSSSLRNGEDRWRASGGWSADVRAAVRHARRRPTSSLAAILTLAVAFAAVLSTGVVAQAVLWRPLPFADSDRVFFVWERVSRDGVPAAARVTRGRFLAWTREGSAFDGLAAFGAWGLRHDTADGPRNLRGLRVSPGYFEVLGVPPLLGRSFAAADGDPGAAPVIVLSHPLWTDLGARPDIVGSSLQLSSASWRVVGVMPPIVSPGTPTNPADVSLDASQREFWVPIVRSPELDANHRSHVFGVVGRLAPGRSVEDAEAALTRTAPPDAPDPHGAMLVPMRAQLVRHARTELILLVAAAVAVLLVAGANLAALLGSAFETRRGEFTVRAALGAGLWRLARQLTIEGLILAVAGGALALVITQVLINRLPSLLPPSVPLLTPPALDLSAIGTWVLLVGAATALISLWPIWRLVSGSGGARHPATRARVAWYRGLVVAQVAGTLALVAAAALLGRSFDHVRGRDAGFAVDHTLVATLGLAAGGVPSPQSVVANSVDLTAAIAAAPGVRSVALAYDHPLAANWIDSYRLVGEVATTSGTSRQAELRIVSPSYFRTVGTEVIQGRPFADDEAWGRPGVAIVNESLARDVGGAILGRRLEMGSPSRMWGPGAPTEFLVVGVVEDERFRGLEQPSRPALYLSTWQFPQAHVMLLVRTAGDPLAVAPAIRTAVRRQLPRATIERVTSLDALLAEQLAGRRITTGVVTTFGAVALALAAIGLYGLMAVSVADRRREFGIRVALGATPASLAAGVLGHGLRWTAIGVAGGLALSFVAGPLLASLLVGVQARDPVTLVVSAAVLFFVTTIATLVPAIRAAGVDPWSAVRAD